MPDSPISATPYEVLGVNATVNDDELRKAYRRLLRETHPDTGGNTARFVAVQAAWERIGNPDDRAAYDRARPTISGTEAGFTWAPRARTQQQDTRPRARAYGHPGGWRRERYLSLMREWVGRGEPLDDPYDPTLVRSAPREIRHILADALAEEATARTLSALGIGYTVWHDVATGTPDEKIDHIVLGPTGLFAVLSEDYGQPVTLKRGEIVSDRHPLHELGLSAKVIAKATRVKFTALVIVLPDDALGDPLTVLGSIRGAATIVVRQSQLPALLRNGVPGARVVGGNELFDVRTRLQSAVRFV
ncbi:DnaJ domain-containing protein [Glaciihabitans sp. UYNi722]|uniref:J domain-containing protein n=1 Tax=Glaciihabitans sp. UYNi722 TaxID=3156344 RepID=UPI003394C4A9